MITQTRPLFPRYRQILTALEGGPLLARELVAAGVVKPMSHIPALLDAGFVSRSEAADVHATWSYHVTDEGRAVLESGVVPCKIPGQNWNAGTPLRKPVVLDPARCVHYWILGSDVAQTGRCKLCGITKEFRSPFLVLDRAPTRTETALRAREDDEIRFAITQAEETLPSTAEAG